MTRGPTLPQLQVGRGDAFLELLARQAVVNFLHNDLHWAVKKFLANAKVSECELSERSSVFIPSR